MSKIPPKRNFKVKVDKEKQSRKKITIIHGFCSFMQKEQTLISVITCYF